jgi:hypothetical protein
VKQTPTTTAPVDREPAGTPAPPPPPRKPSAALSVAVTVAPAGQTAPAGVSTSPTVPTPAVPAIPRDDGGQLPATDVIPRVPLRALRDPFTLRSGTWLERKLPAAEAGQQVIVSEVQWERWCLLDADTGRPVDTTLHSGGHGALTLTEVLGLIGGAARVEEWEVLLFRPHGTLPRP